MSGTITTSGAIRRRREQASGIKRPSSGAREARRKFLHYFPEGFRDENYLDWERGYKWNAHQRWEELLDKSTFRNLLREGEFLEAAGRAIRIESRTNLLFSFEKMALRDAARSAKGAKDFAMGLYDFLYGPGDPRRKFEQWCEVLGGLPRRQTRVLTWPVVTVFAFIALPDEHFFLKPNVTRIAADAYGVDFVYQSRPDWETYSSLLEFAGAVRRDLRDLRPRDMIDLQSFIWVQGSDEYPD